MLAVGGVQQNCLTALSHPRLKTPIMLGVVTMNSTEQFKPASIRLGQAVRINAFAHSVTTQVSEQLIRG